MTANTNNKAPGRTVTKAPYRSKSGPAKRPVKKERKDWREPIQAILEEEEREEVWEWEEDGKRGVKGEVR